MVMVTRSSYRKTCDSFESSGESQKKNSAPPPWCSLAKAQERKKSRRVARETWETRSMSPLRADICEYLRGDKRKLYKRKHSRACCKQTPAKNKGCGKTVIYLAFLVAALGLITTLWMSDTKPRTDLISKVILSRTNLISVFGLQHSLVQEECCSRMKYLVAELLRAEQALKSTLRIRKTLLLTSKTNKFDYTIDQVYVDGISVSRGKDTVEWGSRVALWGVVPLWRAAPPPDIVLSLRRPMPSDCWPFSGSYGELYFDLHSTMRLCCISIEHIYPDTASSAPKNFVLYGILPNGTWLQTVNGQYKQRGPAKQFYRMHYQNIPLQNFIFRILSNQGNPQYTCIYRVHFYENVEGQPNIL